MARARRYLKSDEETRKFAKTLDNLAPNMSTWEVFDDFTTVSACSISNAVDSTNYDQREAEYLRIAKKYSAEQMGMFANLLALTTIAIAGNPHRDFLGDLYSGLELLDRGHQQFFTPYNVSHLMASCMMNEKSDDFEQKGYISICDPSCGSGTLLIAAANTLLSSKRKIATEALLVGKDIDRRVAKMCYITLSLMGCAAIVQVCNSLSFEDVPKSSNWVTPTLLSEDIWVERGYTVRPEEIQTIAA